MSEEEILKLMKTLDDAWNAGPDSPEWGRSGSAMLTTLPCTGSVNPNLASNLASSAFASNHKKGVIFAYDFLLN
jgi:hypothetical protein